MSARGTDFCGDALVERNVTDGFSAQVVWPVSVAACDAVVEAREEGELSAEAFERFEGSGGFEIGSGFGGVQDWSVESEVGTDADEAFRLSVGVFGCGFRVGGA